MGASLTSDDVGTSRTPGAMTRVAGIGGFVIVLLMAGCARLPAPPPDAATPTGAVPAAGAPAASAVPPSAIPAASPTAAAVSPPTTAKPVPATVVQPGGAAGEPARASATPSPAVPAGQAAARRTPPVAKPPLPPAPAAAPARQDSVPAATAKPPASPPLDLAALEQRLKDTKAIGVLTKITLKNQVDDLLSQFRAYYQGKLKSDLAELRRSYDLLVLKVLSLLQDSDQALAASIAASREAIWGILSDPAKFAKI